MTLDTDIQELCRDWGFGGATGSVSFDQLPGTIAKYVTRALGPGAPNGLIVYAELDESGSYNVGYKVKDS